MVGKVYVPLTRRNADVSLEAYTCGLTLCFKFDQGFPSEAVVFQGLIALGVTEANLCGDAVDQGVDLSPLCSYMGDKARRVPRNGP